MSKTDYSKVSPGLVGRVSGVIEESEHHRYSVSRVYAAYNEVFGKREKPQTCSSCLRNRVRELKNWLEGYFDSLKSQEQSEPPVTTEGGEVVNTEGAEGDTTHGEVIGAQADLNNPQFAEPALGVVRTPMEEGLPIDFIPVEGDANKGTVKHADGTAVKPGSYKTARGAWITVQVGGKARMYADGATEKVTAENLGNTEKLGEGVNKDDGENLL